MKCGFGIGYGIGRNYQPIWVSVSVSDRNWNSGFGRTLSRMYMKRPQILVHSHFDLVSSRLAQLVCTTVAQMATQRAFELIFCCASKEILPKSAFLFCVMYLIKTFWNVGEMITPTPWLTQLFVLGKICVNQKSR